VASEPNHDLEQLLGYIRDNRGFDFTGYKRASLERRIRKRMHEVGIPELLDYKDHLEVHPEEFTHLFNTILINVTGFFRDPPVWDLVANEIVPRILERVGPHGHVRIWSVGCASGEEAYTLAMVLAEAVGLPELRDRVKIYATDVDEEALAHARAGVYSAKAIESIPAELRDTYLQRIDGGNAFRKDLRRTVIFGRHDLVQDAPISRVDLISCRNTLMYFNADVQSRIYRAFHFALKTDAVLLLGKSEMLLTRTEMFLPLDLKRRVFQRVSPRGEDRPNGHVGVPDDARLRDAVFESASTAQIVVDPEGALVSANDRARRTFGLSDGDLGRPFHQLQLSYKPVELRSRFDRATSERRASAVPSVAWLDSNGDSLVLDVQVVPLLWQDTVLGVSISFADVTQTHETQEQLERSRRELETAYEEIQSTVEELETTNEELQSTNEELETTNEELQSTNEELETMNEELQSTNEELETINSELQQRTSQLNQANVYLGSILESLQAGVVVLEPDLTIESWNSEAENMWGMRESEVKGKHLFNLDIGLPVDKLAATIRESVAGRDSSEIVLDATNRRGRPITCKVVVSPMKDDGGDNQGVILLMETITG
jgi:two-component system, chemotaxis family, CheB/CheR fusion protein